MCPTPHDKDDIFISYAHIDNQPLAEGLRGWVESLHERLKIRLGQLLGEEANIWRDRKLQGNDIFADTLVEKLSSAAILVSVLSPRYVKSEWCIRELEEFCKVAKANGGLPGGHKLPVFKVVKTFVPLQEHPPQLQGVLGYEFYEYDPERGRAKEFSPEVMPQRDIRYWEKLDDLAYDIKQLIEGMQRAAEAPNGRAAAGEPAAPASGKTVYLAETTSDLSAQRDQVKRELQQHGHAVLPDKELPLDAVSLKQAVGEYLSRSHFSVHLIGEHYGIIPEGEEKSVVHLQSELAAGRGEDFLRLVWMPPGLQSREERQQGFINTFLLGHQAQKGTEVLQTKLEDLKVIIHETASRGPEPEPAAGEAAGEALGINLYLICDKEDLQPANELADYLFNQGVDVVLPAMEGDEAQVYEDHKANLMDCDAVLIYYGRANEIWLRMKLRELQKVAGYGRAAPLLGKAVYLGAPRTEAKERLREHDTTIIKNYEAFSPEGVQTFLARLRKAKGAQG
ncbi:MAG: toll/interleukin-1 receptor domain-containing protein [Acidobacteriota bacterium]|nr:toll/interleukin-1 receptor domain-containing protein [Acidobacteriota bacterium]